MRSKKLKYILIFATLSILFSCNSVNSDAKKAASLVNKSIEQTQKMKLEKAEKTYLKAQKIMGKYTDSDKEVEFYEVFSKYRDKENNRK